MAQLFVDFKFDLVSFSKISEGKDATLSLWPNLACNTIPVTVGGLLSLGVTKRVSKTIKSKATPKEEDKMAI